MNVTGYSCEYDCSWITIYLTSIEPWEFFMDDVVSIVILWN